MIFERPRESPNRANSLKNLWQLEIDPFTFTKMGALRMLPTVLKSPTDKSLIETPVVVAARVISRLICARLICWPGGEGLLTGDENIPETSAFLPPAGEDVVILAGICDFNELTKACISEEDGADTSTENE